jgi:hypothetical protein
MATYSWRVVEDPNGDVVTSGTSIVGNDVQVDDMARTVHDRFPHAVEIAVWAGALADRPDHVLDRLRDGNPRFGDRSQASLLAGVVA